MAESSLADDPLQRIQQQQFTDRAAAEAGMLQITREVYAADVIHIELRPSPISLNSIHGFLTHDDGRRYFFKTHTESDTLIGEYYRARVLSDAGYPVIQPIFRSSEVGRQLLVYEKIADPSVFDVARAIERGRPLAASHEADLAIAQQAEDDALWRRYARELRWQEAADAARAPIHQLFHHRLAGGRFDRFYGGETRIALPDRSHTFAELRTFRWRINGQQYDDTLETVCARCREILQPAQAGPAIIGHGDAHNGNVFLHSLPGPHLSYFDPAFAGPHHPLLDLAKPFYHNVFAMWMYFPQETRAEMPIALRQTDDLLDVTYENALHPVRALFLRSKLQRVLIPTLRELRRRQWLRQDWRAYFKAALACCPLLTLNLADGARFPPQISLLGLAMTMEMGGESRVQRSLIDRALDEAAAAIGS